MRDFLVANKDCEFFTSTITDVEFLVQPYRNKDFSTVLNYMNFLKSLNVSKKVISEDVANKAAEIRAEYKGIKLGDSLQLAASISCGCDCFFTNDLQLRQVSSANVLYLGDL